MLFSKDFLNYALKIFKISPSQMKKVQKKFRKTNVWKI